MVQLHPLAHAPFVGKAHRSETKFEKGASDRNSRPVPVPQATAGRIEMKLAVKVSHYLFSPVKVVHLEYLV